MHMVQVEPVEDKSSSVRRVEHIIVELPHTPVCIFINHCVDVNGRSI